MQILEVTIEGFRSFGPQQTFSVPQEPGLYQLTGRNAIEPDLGANGAGKSTVWDAICWCFFGKTVRGVRGPSVVNWNEDQKSLTAVAVGLSVHGSVCVVTRTQDPNSLTLCEGINHPDPGPIRKVTNDDIVEFLGIDYEFFTSAVLMGQFSRFFFDLSPTEKLNLFSELLQLDVWLKGADEARKKHKAWQGAVEDELHTLGQVEARVEFLAEGLEGAKAAAQSFEEEKADELKTIEEQMTKLLDMEDHQDEIKAKEREIHGLRKQATAAFEKRDEFRREADTVAMRVRNLARETKVLTDQIDDFDSIGAQCETCFQDIPEEHLERVKKELEEKALEAESVRVELQERVAKIFVLLDREQALGSKANDEADRLSIMISSLSRKDAEVTGQLKVLEELHKTIEKKVNTHFETIERIEKDQVGAAEDLERTQQKLAAAKQKVVIYNYWKAGFKELRLWLIEKALIELEISVNNSLIDLGLEGWSVEFDTERENTSGGKTKGFSVLIKSPSSEAAVPWEAWSGGETQRLRIAGAIGLSDLMMSGRKCDCSLEVWDEPTAHLSVEGVDDLLQFMSRRARERKKQIWIVDHRSLESGDFVGELRVIKERDGSKLYQI